MSKRKNEDVLKNIMSQNYLQFNKDALKNAMLHQEVAGQRVFYMFLKQHGYDINPEDMDKCQSDGLIGNCIIECKLNEEEGGGPKKAGQELWNIIPNRLKSKGLRVPYYRIYVELETFLAEIYKWDSYEMIESFDWYEEYNKFQKYFEDKENIYSYDLSEETVDLVEVIQNIYEDMDISDKLEAYSILEKGIPGWFLPFDIKKANINKLILNNDKMNEKYVQKAQGAFFTPSQYVKISTEYVLKAIEESKKDGYDDYIIVDRCAGVGNLESQFPEEVYKHMILGTINSAEALTANIRFNGMTEVVVQDALSREGVLLYKQKIEERIKSCKKLAVIFLENPPYLWTTGSTVQTDSKQEVIKTYVSELNKSLRDLDEQFIWSCFEIYKPYAYVHYGPIKFWKSRYIVDKEVKSAYLCNRKYFNASESSIALLWMTGKNKENDYIEFDSDIDKIKVYKTTERPISYIKTCNKEDAVVVMRILGVSCTNAHLNGDLDNVENTSKANKQFGKYISKDELLYMLPYYVAVKIDFYSTGKNPYDDNIDYRVIDTIYRSADKEERYKKDNKFLQDCLLYVLCTNKHKVSEDNFYKVCEELLDIFHKETEIYKLYKELVESTGVNGLYNIEKYKTHEYGKLYIYGTFGPQIEKLKNLLNIFQYEVIRPKMLEYELLK